MALGYNPERIIDEGIKSNETKFYKYTTENIELVRSYCLDGQFTAKRINGDTFGIFDDAGKLKKGPFYRMPDFSDKAVKLLYNPIEGDFFNG